MRELTVIGSAQHNHHQKERRHTGAHNRAARKKFDRENGVGSGAHLPADEDDEDHAEDDKLGDDARRVPGFGDATLLKSKNEARRDALAIAE